MPNRKGKEGQGSELLPSTAFDPAAKQVRSLIPKGQACLAPKKLG